MSSIRRTTRLLSAIVAAACLFSGWALAATSTKDVTNAITNAVAWTNEGNITSSDNQYAAHNGTGNTCAYALQGNGFGFSIPSDATINGIEVLVEMKIQTGTQSVGAVVTKTSLCDNTNRQTVSVSTTESVFTIGTSSSLWGTTWSPSDVNSSNMTVSISKASAWSANLSVDYVQVRVTYTEASGANRRVIAVE